MKLRQKSIAKQEQYFKSRLKNNVILKTLPQNSLDEYLYKSGLVHTCRHPPLEAAIDILSQPFFLNQNLKWTGDFTHAFQCWRYLGVDTGQERYLQNIQHCSDELTLVTLSFCKQCDWQETAQSIALSLFEHTKRPQTRVSCQRQLGDIYLKQQKFTAALDAFNTALELMDSTEHLPIQNIETRHNRIYLMLQMNMERDFISEYETIIALLKGEADQEESIGVVFGNLANIHRMNGDLEKAFEHYQLGLEYLESTSTNSLLQELQIQSNLGLLYREIDELDLAHEALHHVYSLRNAMLGPIHSLTLESLYNLSLLQLDMGMTEEGFNGLRTTLRRRQAYFAERIVDIVMLERTLAGYLLDTEGISEEVSALYEGLIQRFTLNLPEHTKAEIALDLGAYFGMRVPERALEWTQRAFDGLIKLLPNHLTLYQNAKRNLEHFLNTHTETDLYQWLCQIDECENTLPLYHPVRLQTQTRRIELASSDDLPSMEPILEQYPLRPELLEIHDYAELHMALYWKFEDIERMTQLLTALEDSQLDAKTQALDMLAYLRLAQDDVSGVLECVHQLMACREDFLMSDVVWGIIETSLAEGRTLFDACWEDVLALAQDEENEMVIAEIEKRVGL